MTETVIDSGPKGKGKLPYPDKRPNLQVVQPAPEAPVRANVPLPDTNSDRRGGERVTQWTREGQATAEKLGGWFRDKSLIKDEHPPTLADLAAWWTRTDMSIDPLLGAAQRLDGFTIGLAFVLAGRTIEWVGERPLRRYAILALIVFAFALNP